MHFTETAIACRSPSFTVGEAVGPGPVRAVFVRAMQFMVQDSDHWMKTSDEQYYTPVIPGTPVSAADLEYFRGCGVMLRMALFWQQDIVPVLPMLLALLVGGLEAAMDRNFLAAVAPELAQRLATWPPPRLPSPTSGRLEYQLQLGQDPMNMIMEFIPNTQIAHIRRLSVADAEGMMLRLASELLFHTQDVEHAIFAALREGLDQKNLRREMLDGRTRTGSLLECLQTFRDVSVPQVVAGLCCNRRISSYAVLIPMLKHSMGISPNDREFHEQLDYSRLADRWMQALARYLSGTGHPNDEAFAHLQQTDSDQEISPASLGEAFRPTLFMQAISDSPFIPRNRSGGEAEIEIRFVSSITDQDFAVGHAAVWFHTCTLTMDVVLDEEVAAMLDEHMPEDPSVTTRFDVYIHASLLGAFKDYNTV
ncbi:hypothetical protein NUW54_g7408 [Trametes sanguinea]|uniref:Uncharacterized protein n=1 Tax=Trametes sanguinea TaxID=158606 RepID=A0ACC1PM78_9APHY|nr:hypothetical protein NUW54_g7408 [Trametes sanguinea]